MKKQNRENLEKDRIAHRQETEEVTGREKVSEGAIRKRRRQEEIATKPKIAEDKDTKGIKKYYRGDKFKNRKYLQCITKRRPGTNIGRTTPNYQKDKERKK